MRASRPAALLLAVAAAACGDSPLVPDPTPTPDAAPARNMVRLSHVQLDRLASSPIATGQTFSYAGAPRGSGNWGYTAPDGRRFALTGTSRGTSIDEVTNPSAARHVGIVEGPESNWREIRTLGPYAYVTTEAQHGLDIIDLTNPDQPRKVRTWSDTFRSAHSLWIDTERRLLFANGTNGPNGSGMRVLSLADPVNPVQLSNYTTPYVHDSYLRNDTLFAAAINAGLLLVLDARDPANLREITRFETGGRFTHNAWPTTDGAYLFTTDERPDRPMEVWDIRDVRSPRKVAQYIAAAGTIPHNVMVDGTRLVLSHYTEGVHLLDVSNPERPSVLGYYDTLPDAATGFSGNWGAYIFPGTNLILASDINTGLHVVEYRP